MKGLILVFLALVGMALPVAAQESEGDKSLVCDDERYTPSIEQDEGEYLNGMVPITTFSHAEQQLPDSLHLPTIAYHRAIRHPYFWAAPSFGGYGNWWLHEGFNGSLDLSAFTSFGKGHISGIAEQINIAYAHTVNDHLSFAIGGYFSNVNTNSGAYRAAGIAALLNYRFNEHWEAFLYAQKNLLHNIPNNRYGRWNSMYPYDYFGDLNDRLGIGVRYNFNPSTYVELRFDVERRPNFFPYTPQPKNAHIDNNTPTLAPSSTPRR